MILLAVITATSAFFMVKEAVIGQYRNEVGKALLKARKEFISNETEAECQIILDQAADDIKAAAQVLSASTICCNHDCAWAPPKSRQLRQAG